LCNPLAAFRDQRWNAETDCDCSTCFLTPEQAELNVLLSRPQRHTLVYGGRSDKAMLFVRAIAQSALHAPGSSHGCFGCAAATGAAMAAVP
jgi:hypothetical protein